ncbi:MAG: DUF349 domain-containing protein [Nonlabens sp.]
MTDKDNLHKSADGQLAKDVEKENDLLENTMVETSESAVDSDSIIATDQEQETVVEGSNKVDNEPIDNSTTHADAIVAESETVEASKDPIVEIDDAVEAGIENSQTAVKTADDEGSIETSEQSDESKTTTAREIEKKDYAAMSMKELIDELRYLMQEYPINSFRTQADDIKKVFEAKDAQNKKEKEAAFKEANPPSDDSLAPEFEYKNELALQFNELHSLYRKQKGQFQRERRKQEEENLETRRTIIEGIKTLIHEEENIGSTFKKFNAFQDTWKSTGNIPHDAYNITWEDYRLAVQNFYDYIDVSRELRDKDFERNLAFKKKIINRAQELGNEENIHKALRELQELHRMWKEDAGPVAKEDRDAVWEEFSAATKVIHDKRQAYYEERDAQFEKNQTVKENIIAEIQKITYQGAKNHNQWQERLEEINVLKELFSKTGPAPKNVNNELWDQYRNATREFNKAKNDFYKDLKQEQFDNLAKKRKLVAIAEEHENSENFKESFEVIKKIQAEWKTIGHVPRKDSDKIWKRFRKACDGFFDKKTAQRKDENQEELNNYQKKLEIYDQLKELLPEDDKKALKEKVQNIMSQWAAAGRVPHSKRHVQEKFEKLVKAKLKSAGMSEVDAEMLKYQNKLDSLSSTDSQDFKNERFYLNKRKGEIESEVRQLENNLQFINAKDDQNPFLVQQRKNIDKLVHEMQIIQEKQKKLNILQNRMNKESSDSE